MSATATQQAVEAVWRIEAARLIAGLARMVRDVGLAEDLAQDALLAALEQWPSTGIPDAPGAWLMTVAKRRGVDAIRRQVRLQDKLAELGRQSDDGAGASAEVQARLDEQVDDDVLRLIFTACHPVLGTDARVALALKVLAGLTTQEIARAFLVPPATVAQRIVRAKRTLAAADVPFEVPGGAELAPRLASVLEVVYLVFNEGYAATSGADWTRPALCEEAMRLGRILAALAPAEPEAHGLVALMEIQASRLGARRGPRGEVITLDRQDRGRWDQLLIHHGLDCLDRAARLGGSGPYVLQAAIAACHARAGSAEQTDWHRIATLYGVLAAREDSPVIELNRAVAVAMAEGPAAGLELVDRLADEPALRNYHLLPSVRGDLLQKLDRPGAAQQEFRRAAELTENAAERALLLARAETCAAEVSTQ